MCVLCTEIITAILLDRRAWPTITAGDGSLITGGGKYQSGGKPNLVGGFLSGLFQCFNANIRARPVTGNFWWAEPVYSIASTIMIGD